MRRVRYRVATSLDGYIADRTGGDDWITHDPEIDFVALFSQFDTLLIGRKTFEDMVRRGIGSMPGMKLFVFSRTLRQSDFPEVTIVAGELEKTVQSLRGHTGKGKDGKNTNKDIWLFGGGSLFASLLDAGLVDTVEVAVIPILLGGGVPLFPSPTTQAKLKLSGHKVYKSGIVLLEYAVK